MKISIAEFLRIKLNALSSDSNEDPRVKTIKCILDDGIDVICSVEVDHLGGERFAEELFDCAYGEVSERDKVAILACAALIGHCYSMNDLGWCLHFGKGIKTNYELSIYWHERAAALGDSYAMQNLGKIYTEKDSPVWDGKKGIEWFEKAVKGGEVLAKGDLAHCLLCGKCVPKDASRAEELLVQAISCNHNREDWQEDLAHCPLAPGEIRTKYGQKMRQIDIDFYNACRTGTVKDLEELLAKGANPNAAWYNDIGDDFYPVHQAALNPDFEVLKFVIGKGADPCQCDFWTAQPLAYASRKGSLEKVKYLVELGNDANRVDYDGSSVIGAAAANPDIKVIEYLLEQGADINDSADDQSPLCNALPNSTPERIRWLIEHGAWVSYAVEHRAYRTPLENLRAVLELGYDPNTFDEDSTDTKVIDHLDSKRRALFEEFGGQVLNYDAEKYYLKYKGEIKFYERHGVVEFDGRKYSLCEDPAKDNAPSLNPRGIAFGVRHDAEMDLDGYYPCSTLYFINDDYLRPVDATEGTSESMRFNPVLCEFRAVSSSNPPARTHGGT